jgi:uncharacterized protein YcbX
MRVDRLYRYPVKGLSAEAMEAAHVEAGAAIPWDRAFALAQGDAAFDPEQPRWLPKTNFMCLRQNGRIALLKSAFDERHGRLTILAPDGSGIEENALLPAGRARIGAWLAAYLGPDARGAPRFHYVPGHVFGDQRAPVVSLINEASRADLEARVGSRRHRRRFRANVWFSGLPAWGELEWVGRDLLIGSARLRVTRRTSRCPATEVNPETGERDADPVAELKAAYGHADLGVHAEVIEAGNIAIGDAIEVLEPEGE